MDWNVYIEPGYSFGYTLDESRKSQIYSRYVRPPYIIGQTPGYDTKLYTYAKANDGNGYSLRLGAQSKEIQLNSKLIMTVGLGVDMEQVDMTYGLEHWAKFDGINPFTGGVGGDPIRIGKGDIEIKHIGLTPEIKVEFKTKLGKIEPFLRATVGYSYLFFESFDLEPITYQPAFQSTNPWLPVGLPTSPIPSKTNSFSYNQSDSFRFSLGGGVNYQLSKNWNALIAFEVFYIKGYNIISAIESNSTTDSFGYRIDSVMWQRVSVGMQYRF